MDYEVDIELEKQSPINVDLRLETSGISEHNLLKNRDLPDQHPISAITGLQEALDTIPDDYVSDAELEVALLEKQDVISDLATIRRGAALGATAVQNVTTGSTNGTISVDGSDVAVHGLGSAAYTASTAYDVSGAASTAETNAKNYADGLASNYATAAQGALADTALQAGDNVSELTNNSGYITRADLPTNHVTTDTAQDITGLKTIKNQLKIQSGYGDGALFIGADVAATTLKNGSRKIARVNMPTQEDITLPMTIISGDTLGDAGSTIEQRDGTYNRIEFGGRTGATGNTSPDGVAFCVAKVHNSKLSTDKVYALEMSATQARFNVQPKYNGTNLALSTDIPTVNNATLTIQKNGSNVATFTANASSNVTANISVPNTVSSVSSSSTNADAVGAKLFYDTVGDIETLINAL